MTSNTCNLAKTRTVPNFQGQHSKLKEENANHHYVLDAVENICKTLIRTQGQDKPDTRKPMWYLYVQR